MPKVYAVEPGKEVEVTLPSESDVKVEKRTIWIITSPDVRDFARVQNELYDVSGFGKGRKERFRTGDQQIEILRLGLRGWRNFTDQSGKEVEWKDPKSGKSAADREKIMVDNINHIPEAARGELVDLIRGEANVSQD